MKDSIIPVLALTVIFSACSFSSKNESPNIIIILADDMGYSDIACFGGEVHTPNIDTLAYNGVRFTGFYNAARCCPTRAALLTGLYPHEAGMGGMDRDPVHSNPGAYQGYLSDQSVTIAEVLKTKGYYTALSGKWHVGSTRPNWPIDRGFDNFFGLLTGASNYFNLSKGRKEGQHDKLYLDSLEYKVPDDFYMTDEITRHAIKFIQKSKEKKKPLFLYLAYTAPHWPLHARQEDIDKYRGKYLKGWNILAEERLNRMIEMNIVNKNIKQPSVDSQIPDWELLSTEKKDTMDLLMSIYAAQIDRMDQNIGILLEELKKNRMLENTLILFLSDNGGCAENDILGTDFWGNFNEKGIRPGSGDSFHSYGQAWAHLSNTPFSKYKKNIHEGGISTPLIAYWPNEIVHPNRISEINGHVIDLMATCCDVAEVDYPEFFNGKEIKPTQGMSMLPVFKDVTFEGHEVLYWEHIGNKGIRKGEWKLVKEKNQDWELYNIHHDRAELENLKEKFPEKVDILRADYELWANKVGVIDK